METGFRLGDWVNSQRVQVDSLPKDFINTLNELGFVWNARDILWMHNYEALVDFQRANGHCLVEKNFLTEDGLKLGHWVSNQRVKKDTLSNDRVKKLDAIGFIWNVQEYQWQQYYSQLVKYQAENGNVNLSSKQVIDGWSLGYWLNKQRKSKSKLSDEQIRQLDDLGVNWVV